MNKKNIFWGLLFILAAVLIVINQFGFFTGISMFDIVATVILAGIIIKSIIYINFWGICFPLAFLCIIFADQLKISKFAPWPVLLIALLFSIGLSLVFRGNHGWFFHFYHHDHDNSFSSRVVNEQDDSKVSCTASFGECMKYVNSVNFERADVRCSFGEVKVYFDNAQIPSGKADIYLDVSFGDAELYIPKSWKIINKVHVFLGDMDEKNRNVDAVSPVVTIHGNISFGDAQIIFI